MNRQRLRLGLITAAALLPLSMMGQETLTLEQCREGFAEQQEHRTGQDPCGNGRLRQENRKGELLSEHQLLPAHICTMRRTSH